MTANQTQDQSQQVFSSAFFAALVSALTEASGSPWLVAALADAPPAAEEGEPVWVSLTLDGSLPGLFLLEFRRSEAALLASKCLRQPVAEFSSEHSQALLQAIEAACEAFCSAQAQQHGTFTIRAAIVPKPGGEPGVRAESTLADNEDSRVSIALYLGPELAQALATPPVAPDPRREAAAVPEPPGLSELSPIGQSNLNLVMDVELNVTLRFGQRKLTLREVLELTSGSVIELDRQVEEPVELLLDGKVIARGEAVVIDGNYGLRVTEVPRPIAPASLH